MFPTSIPRRSSLNRKRSERRRTPAEDGIIHFAMVAPLYFHLRQKDTSVQVMWAQMSSPDASSDPAKKICLMNSDLNVLIPGNLIPPSMSQNRRMAHLPWVEGKSTIFISSTEYEAIRMNCPPLTGGEYF